MMYKRMQMKVTQYHTVYTIHCRFLGGGWRQTNLLRRLSLNYIGKTEICSKNIQMRTDKKRHSIYVASHFD